MRPRACCRPRFAVEAWVPVFLKNLATAAAAAMRYSENRKSEQALRIFAWRKTKTLNPREPFPPQPRLMFEAADGR
jgi:hypothetical protein